MKKAIVIFAAAALLTACGAKTETKYVDTLREAGVDEAQIAAYEEYEKTNQNIPEGGYIDVTGKTAEEAAKERGMTFEEFVAENNLPENLPPVVSETEALYTVPVSKEADFYGMSFEEFKRMLNLPDSVTEDTPWGVALGETTIGAYIGEENAEKFIEEYKLGADVSADTKWKEVREKVDSVKRERRIQSEKENQ